MPISVMVSRSERRAGRTGYSHWNWWRRGLKVAFDYDYEKAKAREENEQSER